MTQQELINSEIESSERINTIIRIASYFLLVLSICMLFWPITRLIGYVPLIGNFIANVISLAIFIAACILALPIFLLILSIAWLFYHPKIGIPLLVLGLAGTAVAIYFATRSSPAAVE